MEIINNNNKGKICIICQNELTESEEWILTPAGYKCEKCWKETTQKVYR